MESDKQLVEALGMSKRDVLTAAVWALANLGEGDVKKSWTGMKSKCSEWRAGKGSMNGMRPNAEAVKTAEEAEQLLAEGAADLIGVGRELLKNPKWADENL